VNVKIADFGLARAQLDNGEAMTGVLGTFVIKYTILLALDGPRNIRMYTLFD